MKNRIKNLLAPKTQQTVLIIYTLFVTVLFLMPKPDLPTLNTRLPIDKIGHTVIHFLLVLGWLVYFFTILKHRFTKQNSWWIVGVCFLYGIIIELLQQLIIPLRQADFFDVIANTIGLLLGFTTFWKIKNKIFS